MLKNIKNHRKYSTNSLEQSALSFIRNSCQGLRFDKSKTMNFNLSELDFDGTSLKKNQIPYNYGKRH